MSMQRDTWQGRTDTGPLDLRPSAVRVTTKAGPTPSNDDRTFKAVRDLIEAGEEVWITVTGRSMEPTLHPGDRVLLRPPESAWFRGRVVLSEFSGRPVLHRLLHIRPETVTTAGDACRREDPPVSRSALIAEAVAVQCKRGTVPLLPTLRFGKWVVLRYFGATARQASRRAWWRAVAALRTVRATGDVA